MKKFVSLALVLLMLVSLAACGGSEDKTPATQTGTGHKLGLGSVNAVTLEGTDKSVVKTTVAGVLLDKDGKIVDCEIEEAEIPVSLVVGEVQLPATLDNKNDDAWESQVEAFCDYVEGKTGAEVSAIAATDGKSSEIAGCDLVITDFILAVRRAADAAKEKASAKEDDLSLAVTVAKSYESTDAKPKFDVEMAVVTLAENDTITGCVTDSASATLAVEAGAFSHEAGAFGTKREAGDAYGMKAASSIQKEWYEQADVLDAFAVGKTADALVSTKVAADGKTDAIAGCTMAISGMLKNAVKAAKD